MAVNLKRIPAPARQPAPPEGRVWLLLLLTELAAASLFAIFSDKLTSDITVKNFCQTVLTFPLFLWLALLIIRLLWFWGQKVTAARWNELREQTVQQEMRRGQRSLQVLGYSLHSALREPPDSDGQQQWKAFQQNVQAIKTQASWHSEEGVRHSRLMRMADETPEQLLSRILGQTLAELSLLLASVPADMPLALLLESSGSLTESQRQAVWQACWQASGIRQPVTPVTGNGLAAVDNWLDAHSHERALLLVVAFQIDPEQPEHSAEAVVGLLLGNAEITTGLRPLAGLHRPEQAHQTTTQDLRYALAQSLGWVPVSADAVTTGWLVGVEASWHKAIAIELTALSLPINPGRDLHDLDRTLGYPGAAAPWLAIACAAGVAQSAPQLIVSGDGTAETPLWSTVVMPG
ncbi:hypothetical protein ACQK5W_11050 [Pantoea sp. FN060301]|uniref:hypothetical protein n=1 Tax=Pantoea sp. FN060301 TaxID=3420380 RepID=UPI003D172BF7